VQPTRDINKCCEIKDEILNRKYREHLATLNENKTRDLTDALLKVKLDEEKMDKDCDLIEEDHVIMTMQDVFIAGNETSTTTILWTLVHLITHPKIQAKIHARLDEVVGFDRKPELKDRENLPYIEAVLAETSRLSSVVPLAIPHKSIRDTTLQGYTIPKDTVVILNLWAIHHDEQQWNNPMEFRPERFLDSEGKLRATSDLSYMPFGAGRRACLGEVLAKQEMFLIITGLLQQFEFKSPSEPLKQPLAKDGIVRAPLPFEVCIRKRIGAK
jgi:steroid 17alpha-monooxygenase/17alpha-hydroxyprogesterone aldolase